MRNEGMVSLGIVVVILSMLSFVDTGSQVLAAQARWTPLSPEEKADLVYMREEEKLARDVYLAMFSKWGKTIFSNISKSE